MFQLHKVQKLNLGLRNSDPAQSNVNKFVCSAQFNAREDSVSLGNIIARVYMWKIRKGADISYL